MVEQPDWAKGWFIWLLDWCRFSIDRLSLLLVLSSVSPQSSTRSHPLKHGQREGGRTDCLNEAGLAVGGDRAAQSRGGENLSYGRGEGAAQHQGL